MTAVQERLEAMPAQPLPPPRRRRPAGTLLLVALAGLLFFVAAYVALRDRDETHAVLYLGSALEAGQRLEPSQLAQTAVEVDDELLSTLVPAAGRDRLAGMVAAHPLAEGRLLQAGDLREPAAPASRRAMSLPVASSYALGGELRVGDRVDVLVATETAAVFVATDIEILTANLGSTGALDAGASTVTLAVDADVARSLASALERGNVHLLRSNGAPPVPAEQLPDFAGAAAQPVPGEEAGDDAGAAPGAPQRRAAGGEGGQS